MQTLDVISVNIWQIIISLANLVILFLLFKKFLFKPVKEMIAKREAAVEAELDAAKHEHDAANEERRQWEAKMASADEEADRIILLDYNRIFCFFSALGRYRKYKNRTRPDMADGCDEKFDLDFALWILWKGRGRKQRDRHDRLEKMYGDKFIRIRSRRRLNKMLREGRI